MFTFFKRPVSAVPHSAQLVAVCSPKLLHTISTKEEEQKASTCGPELSANNRRKQLGEEVWELVLREIWRLFRSLIYLSWIYIANVFL